MGRSKADPAVIGFLVIFSVCGVAIHKTFGCRTTPERQPDPTPAEAGERPQDAGVCERVVQALDSHCPGGFQVRPGSCRATYSPADEKRPERGPGTVVTFGPKTHFFLSDEGTLLESGSRGSYSNCGVRSVSQYIGKKIRESAPKRGKKGVCGADEIAFGSVVAIRTRARPDDYLEARFVEIGREEAERYAKEIGMRVKKAQEIWIKVVLECPEALEPW